MNAKKAKALRRGVYKDISLIIPRVYVGGKIGLIPQGYITNTIRNAPDSLRAKYQRIKRLIKQKIITV